MIDDMDAQLPVFKYVVDTTMFEILNIYNAATKIRYYTRIDQPKIYQAKPKTVIYQIKCCKFDRILREEEPIESQ